VLTLLAPASSAASAAGTGGTSTAGILPALTRLQHALLLPPCGYQEI
jgi:hypothetical protein